MMLRIAAVFLGAMLAWPQLAAAQSLSFSSKDSDKPITVTAQEGLEWRQTEKQFIARGAAKAVQDETEVTADQLIAHYREKPGTGAADENGTEVYRVDAVGHVIVKSKNETATGDAAVYDFDRKVLVMQGNEVNLVTGDGNVTAHKTLQYWSEQNVAVAEGDAVAVDTTPENAGRRIRADKLTAFFRDAGDKKDAKGRDLIFLQGAGNVVLTTKTEIVRGDRADYNLDTGMATVEGGVKMTRDKNQLNGGYAVVNVKGGVSRLYGSAAEAKGAGAAPPARVRALLAPSNRSTDDAPLPQGNTR